MPQDLDSSRTRTSCSRPSPPSGDDNLFRELRDLVDGLRDEVQALRDDLRVLRETETPPADQEGTDDLSDADTEPLLTRKQAARRLSISTRLLDDLEDEGEIRSVRIRGRVLYERSEIESYIRAQAGEDGRQ